MENLSIYLKKFKIAVYILVAGIIIAIALLSKIIPAVQNVQQLKNDYKSQEQALQDAERKLQNLKSSQNSKKDANTGLSKAVFKPITEGLDTEAAISDEFAEILQLIKENKIKTRSVKYDYDPQDDKFVQNAANKYHVCRVTTELIATYSQFENFLRDLYKHEHFLDIDKIEINPYQKNKKILLINFAMKLYAERDPSSVVETKPAEPQAQKGQKGPNDIQRNPLPEAPEPPQDF